MSKVIGIEGKCGVGKSTYLVELGVLSPEFMDYHVDEITYNKDLGLISFEDQLTFVKYKVEELIEKLNDTQDVVYMDRQVLSPIAFGAGYYEWYGLSKEEINDYLNQCYELLKKLPEGWNEQLEALILIAENEDNIRDRIISRGRKFEVDHIDNIIAVNNKYFKYLIDILNKFNVKYRIKVVEHRG